MIKAIVCCDKNFGIGKNGGLLFNLKADMEYFKTKTLYSIVVMGENTLLSFPKQKPLKNRVNIVLCPEGHEYEGCICIHNFDQLVTYVNVLSKVFNVWVIGGGMMYRSMLPYYDKIYITEVDAEDKEATVFFPDVTKEGFKLSWESETLTESEYKFKYCCYEKIKSN